MAPGDSAGASGEEPAVSAGASGEEPAGAVAPGVSAGASAEGAAMIDVKEEPEEEEEEEFDVQLDLQDLGWTPKLSEFTKIPEDCRAWELGKTNYNLICECHVLVNV